MYNLINRQAANDDWEFDYAKDRMIELSAQPERKKGKWVRITSGAIQEEYICSVCGRHIKENTIDELMSIRYPFCHCGADMRGEQDDE